MRKLAARVAVVVVVLVALGAPASAAKPWPKEPLRDRLATAFDERDLRYFTNATDSIGSGYANDTVALYTVTQWPRERTESPKEATEHIPSVSDPEAVAQWERDYDVRYQGVLMEVSWFSSKRQLNRAASGIRETLPSSSYLGQWTWRNAIIQLPGDASPEVIAAVRRIMRDLHARRITVKDS